MQINRIEATNFGSYKNLALDFTEAGQGLTLIQGANGSGKSTLCDLVPWILFGKTSKGGSVDEIRSWGSKDPTTGKLLLSLPNGEWEVLRIRGKTNDLSFRRAGVEGLSRGKDLTDTQRLLNDVLGIDYDLYLAGAYYHEFNQTAQFFTTTAKTRRTICEQLVDLSLAVKIQERLKDERRIIDKHILAAESDLRVEESTLRLLKTKGDIEARKRGDWDTDHVRRISTTAENFDRFEKNRTRRIVSRCPTCHQNVGECKEIFDESENPYFARLKELDAEKNPYLEEAKTYEKEIEEAISRVRELTKNIDESKDIQIDNELLAMVTEDYRGRTIENTIDSLEERTNALLADFFDAEIRVVFRREAADKLEVLISKDGNLATFTQLSKGQRQLLKLCFGISVMQAVQNHHGISLNQLWFDEATDGLSDHMKLKVLHMLETLTLEYGQIFLVEHSEALKAMVNNKYQVTLVDGESQIEAL